MRRPSGRQVVLTSGDQELVVVEVGGAIRTYTVAGVPVLDGYGEDEMASGGRGQPLIPWPNRLADGRFEWGGHPVQAPLDEPERSNAIHGLVRWARWQVDDASTSCARLVHRLPAQPAWPWPLDVAVTYRLGGTGLEVRTAVTNAADEPCPLGVGWHPYLHAFGGVVDDATLRLPAATAYRSDERGLPAGRGPVAGTPADYRDGRPIGSALLDTCYTDLARGPDGRAAVELRAGDGSAGITVLWMDAAYTHVMVFSGDTLDDPARRRRGLAVEPMTGAPNLLRSGDGRRTLEPGETFEASWGLQAHPR